MATTSALVLAFVVLSPGVALADPAHVESLHDERIDSGRGHLWRNLAVGGASVIGGTALTLASDREGDPFRWGFGVQTAIWGAIDVGIGVTGLLILRPSDAPKGQVVARKEQLYHDVLLFNMGLDVAYIAVGSTIVIASYHGLDNPREWRGHGTAIILQGAALLSLETFEWFGSRERLRRLRPTVGLSAGGTASLGLGGEF